MALVLDPEIVRTQPAARRPFQGWRYLQVKDAPRALSEHGGELGEMPEELRRELAGLGLL